MRYLNFESYLAFVVSISALSTYCDNKSGVNGVKVQSHFSTSFYIAFHVWEDVSFQ